MGLPIAGNLADAGHELWIYDVREDAMAPLLARQARRATSRKDLADSCRTVVISLPTRASCRGALAGSDGLLAGEALTTLIKTSTVGGPFVCDVEAQRATRKLTVIDAPISGGVNGVQAGTLAVMVSGEAGKIVDLTPVV